MPSLSLAFDILAKDRASKEFDSVGNAVDRAGAKGSKFGTVMKAGLLAGATAAIAFGKSSVDAFVESEQSSLRLDAALAKFPQTNDVARKSFDSLNESLAKKTKFDDDATASGQAVLAQFGLTGKQIQKLTPLLQDYAAKTGKDLPDAAGVLGKALLGKGRALAEVGIKFKDAGSTGANFDQVVSGLRTQVGGFAEQQGKSAAGRAEILKNQFGELQEEVGGKLTPVLTSLAGKLLDVIGFIDRNKAVIGPLVAVLGTLAAVVVTITTATKIWTAVQAAFNVVMALNPIGLVVIALAALALAIALAWKNSETFRNAITAAFTAVKTVVMNSVAFIVDKFLGMAEWIVKGAAKAFGWIPGIGPKLKSAAAAIEQFRDEANAALRGIKDKTVRITVEMATRGVVHQSGSGKGAVSMDERAHGGPVRGGSPYLVGERGPEVFVAPRSGVIIPNNRLGGVTYSPRYEISGVTDEIALRRVLDEHDAELVRTLRALKPA